MRVEEVGAATLIHGDCLEVMQLVPDGSVDMILCDLPYGVTACKWDIVIPFGPLWDQYKRIIKPYGAIVLFGSEPFSSLLRTSNLGMFKYDWVWHKNSVSGVAQAKNKPLSNYETISVFSDGVTVHASQTTKRMPYFPQGLKRIDKTCKNSKHEHIKAGGIGQRPSHKDTYVQEWTDYPRQVLSGFVLDTGSHPTQKPVALCEYLIKTYTNEGETVLDNTMGSGTTGVACVNTNRHFIGIEKDNMYFGVSVTRIASAKAPT